MKFVDKLDQAVEKNNSLLCVGLDPDLDKLPEKFEDSEKPLFEFNKEIIDATADLVCCYKPNSAFYEALGAEGIQQLKDTCEYIQEKYSEIPILLDFKRGDIGNTNAKYGEFAFAYLEVDAITLHPYQGGEALEPFYKYADKGLFILVKFSNPGSGEFQNLVLDNKPLYEHVTREFMTKWNKNGNIMMMGGATYPKELGRIREISGDPTPILVPGVGAQEGLLEETLKAGLNRGGKGLIINASRGVIYSANPRSSAENLRNQINQYR